MICTPSLLLRTDVVTSWSFRFPGSITFHAHIDKPTVDGYETPPSITLTQRVSPITPRISTSRLYISVYKKRLTPTRSDSCSNNDFRVGVLFASIPSTNNTIQSLPDVVLLVTSYQFCWSFFNKKRRKLTKLLSHYPLSRDSRGQKKYCKLICFVSFPTCCDSPF